MLEKNKMAAKAPRTIAKVLLALSALDCLIGEVQAEPVYAVSTAAISSFGLVMGAGTSFSGFTISSDQAGLNSAGGGNASALDAAPTCLGCGYNNSFFSHGNGTTYSYGDARISNAGLPNGSAATSGISEVSIGTGVASAAAFNNFIGFVSVAQPGSQLGFSFVADPLLRVLMSAGGIATSADVGFIITLTDTLGNTVFSWMPDGQAGGVGGGLEISDPFSLNYGVSLTMTTGESLYDPLAGHFAATSNPLDAGFYQLSMSISNHAMGVNATVPEPGTLLLMVGGMTALAIHLGRRRLQS